MVTREPNTELVRPHRAFSRVVSFLLLAFIVYGTTIEAAHTHGSVLAPNATVGAGSFSETETETKLNGNLVGCGDCLICQLHQQFSATLISGPPSIGTSALTSRFVSLTTVSIHSHTNAPRTGRAPPRVS